MVVRPLALALVGLALAAPAGAAAPTAPVYDDDGRLVDTPFAPLAAERLSEGQATRILLRHPQVADWLDRYPPRPQTEAEYRPERDDWEVRAWSGDAGQIVLGVVEDDTGRVVEAWTGPQVAWTMARGGAGAFGGRTINGTWLWLGFCAVFLLGLADLRRPLALRNLDLLALLSFSVSLRFFNEGEVFWSVPLAYPPLVYLLARSVWIARSDRPPRASPPVWPVWLLAGACVFLGGFRVGLNVEAERSVIDVGFAGVVGAQRIAGGQMPYGHMPEQKGTPCGPADASGDIRERIQTNGRCEAANPRGDTYGPVSYLAYLPGYAVFGWSGKWDELWAAHATSLLFDALCLAGLVLVGRRFGGARLGATLAFAWVAYPFTLYASNSNTNDAIMPAFLIWGFWLASSAWARGAAVALAGWTKFAALLLAPLWLSYPGGLRVPARRFAAGFAVATAASFLILLLEPDPLHAARVFAERTVGFQLDRDSPFSIWGWGQYRAAGIPDLKLVQQVLQVLVVAGAVALAFVPRRKSILQLAALTAAVLLGFELVLTHWFYLYIPWFFPFFAFALLYRRDRAALFLLSWGALHTAWYDDAEIVDTPVYQAYGDAIEDGAVPYRDIRPEYPPGALLAFVVPSLVSSGEAGYRDAFEWLMALFGVATVLLTAVALRGLGATRGRTLLALGFVGGFPLLLGSVVLTRFDLFPAALVAGALAAVVHGRDRLGFGVLGAAVAVKLYPGVLVPVALAWVWRRHGRREALLCLGIAAAVVVAVFLPFLLASPEGVARSIGRQLSRPLQIESLGSALYLAAHHLLGVDVEMRSGHGSQNLHATGTGVAAVLLTAVQLGALVWIWLRRPASREELVRWSAAALVAFVALGKVLSPQFLIWLLPAVPLVAAAGPSLLLAAALVLTQAWFPSRYWDLARELDPLVSALVLARDGVLVALLVALLTARRRAPARSP